VDIATGGDTTATLIDADGDVALTLSAGDLTVDSITAAGQTVTLNVAGVVGDSVSSPAIVADALQVNAAGVGSTTDTFNVDVGALSGQVGEQGVYIDNVGTLVIAQTGLSAQGHTQLTVSSGDLNLVGDVSLSGGAALSLNASTGAVHQAPTSTISTESGSIDVLGYSATDVSRVVTTTGQVQVKSETGGFSVASDGPGLAYGDQPAVVQGTSFDVAAPISGTGTLEIRLPGQGSAPLVDLSVDSVQVALTAAELAARALPQNIVIGNTVGQGFGSPVEGGAGLFIDNDELALIVDGFESIVLGSQDPRQTIWINGDQSASVVFNDPLVLVSSGVAYDDQGDKLAAGEVNITGSLFGEGLTVLGSGSTTHLYAAHVVEAGDVVINDSLVVESDSTIRVSTLDGLIDIRGSILVKSGATLTLDASEIRLGSYAGRGDSLVLEAGAQLVIGTAHLIVADTLVIDGGGDGTLVLQGQLVGANRTDFKLSAGDLEQLTTQMVDGSFAELTVGSAGTLTTVLSPSLWSEQIASIGLSGSTVRLGEQGVDAIWRIGSHAVFEATDGDLELHADLLSDTGAYINLTSDDGQVRMAATATIVDLGGVVSLNAATGITVGEIDTSLGAVGLSGAVSLDSAGGNITLAAPADGVMGIRAQAVSMFGYGQLKLNRAQDLTLRVEAESLQVSAPTGLVSLGLNAAGAYYRLMDQGTLYAQLEVVGSLPTDVLMSRADVAQQPVAALESIYRVTQSNGVQPAALGQWSQLSQQSNVATRDYLNSMIRPVIRSGDFATSHRSSWIDLATEIASQDDLLLSDLSYGFSDDGAASFVLGLPGVQPLSSGSASTDDVWFDYLASGN
jgi:hypothetical protein